jgi:autoinducer 2-degrading protein
MYTVIVNLQVKPDMVEAFLEAMGENSRASRRDEPGCLRFDVHRDNDDPNHTFATPAFPGELPEAGR